MFRRKKDDGDGLRIAPAASINEPSFGSANQPKPLARPSLPSAPAPVQPAGPTGMTRPPAPAPTPLTPPPGAARRPVEVAAPTAAHEEPAPIDPEQKKLIVGREIFLSGEITSCDRLIVEGRVEATLTQSRTIEIAESGFFKGSADIENAEIAGRFEGTLTARGKLLIRSTGHLTGQIVYGQIEIELGGQIIGDVQVAGSASQAGRKGMAASDEPRREERAVERVAASGESD